MFHCVLGRKNYFNIGENNSYLSILYNKIKWLFCRTVTNMYEEKNEKH